MNNRWTYFYSFLLYMCHTHANQFLNIHIVSYKLFYTDYINSKPKHQLFITICASFLAFNIFGSATPKLLLSAHIIGWIQTTVLFIPFWINFQTKWLALLILLNFLIPEKCLQLLYLNKTDHCNSNFRDQLEGRRDV